MPKRRQTRLTSPPSSVLFDKGVTGACTNVASACLSADRRRPAGRGRERPRAERPSPPASTSRTDCQRPQGAHARFAAPFCFARAARERSLSAPLGRRLRDFGFSPEDAVVLATEASAWPKRGQGRRDLIVTTDSVYPRYGKYRGLGRRFRDMVTDLSGRYADLTLSRVVTTSAVCGSMTVRGHCACFC